MHSMKKKIAVLGIGAVVEDELVVLPHFPRPDEKIEIIDHIRQVGGPVPTALRMLYRLGIPVSFIGKVGTDEDGNYIKSELVHRGIDISCLVEEDAKSGFAQIWIVPEKHTRSIAYSTGTLTPFKHDDFVLDNLPEAELLHIDGRDHDAVQNVIRHFKSSNTIISIDTGTFRERTLELLPLADILIMPRHFPEKFTGRHNMETLLKKMHHKFSHAYCLVITDGKNGSICMHKGRLFHQPAFKVKALDTSGAGDVHAGTLLYGILKKWPLNKTLRFAAAAAALKCTGLGNTHCLPGLSDIQGFLKGGCTYYDVDHDVDC